MLDRVDAFEVMALLIDDRRRQRRHRIATAKDGDTGLSRSGIEYADAIDERPAVRQIAIVDARLDAAFGHRIGLQSFHTRQPPTP